MDILSIKILLFQLSTANIYGEYGHFFSNYIYISLIIILSLYRHICNRKRSVRLNKWSKDTLLFYPSYIKLFDIHADVRNSPNG